jgi:hypothetical protein
VVAVSAAARADEAQAKALFKGMSDYLAAQQAISLEYDSYLEVITRQEQTLGLASSGTVTLNRPDKIRATRTGGFANVELVFDGKTATLIGKNANLYAQVEVPGTIDELVDELREKYHRPLPAADLLMSNAYDQLMPLVRDTKDLGSGVIRGIECDHLAFRTEEVDIQIWIASLSVSLCHHQHACAGTTAIYCRYSDMESGHGGYARQFQGGDSGGRQKANSGRTC